MPHIFITGQPGCGKSTLIKRVLNSLSSTYDTSLISKGFYTEEVRVSGERVGFDVVTLSGARGVLSRAGESLKGPRVGKYVVNVLCFETLALNQLSPSENVLLHVVDEVGKMELLSKNFFPAVVALLDSAPLVLGTIPLARQGRSLPQVDSLRGRRDVEIITITKYNRDQMMHSVLHRVQQHLERSLGAS